jgi:hypothetical protein
MEFTGFGPCVRIRLVLVMLEESLGFQPLFTAVGVNGVGKDLDQLRIGQEWDTEIDSCSAHLEVILETLGFVSRNVDHQTNFVVADHVTSVGDIGGSLLGGVRNQLAGNTVLDQDIGSCLGGIQSVSKFVELVGRVGELVLKSSLYGNKNVLLGQLEPSREESLEEGFLAGGTEILFRKSITMEDDDMMWFFLCNR